MSRSDRMMFCHPGMVARCVLSTALVITAIGFVRQIGFFSLLVALPGAWLLFGGVREVRTMLREDRIGHTGTDAWATVTKLSKHWLTDVRLTRFELRYRYEDADGGVHDGRTTVSGFEWGDYKGEPLHIRYDPREPQYSALVWSSLWHEGSTR